MPNPFKANLAFLKVNEAFRQVKRQWLGIGKITLPSIRAELEDPEDVVGENPSVVVVHGQPQGAARLVVRSVHHQELKEAKTVTNDWH